MKILYYAGLTLTRVISTVIFSIRLTGREHLPETGGFILATNHVSYFDPLLAGSWVPRQVYFLGKKELFENRIFGWVISHTNALPVRRGTFDRHALDLCVNVIKNGYGMTIFPEGTRSKTDSFLEPKAGIGMLAVAGKCPIVPAYIHGSNRLRDCFWRKQRLSITYGEPLSADWVSSFSAEKDSYVAIAKAVMTRIEELKRQALDIK